MTRSKITIKAKPKKQSRRKLRFTNANNATKKRVHKNQTNQTRRQHGGGLTDALTPIHKRFKKFVGASENHGVNVMVDDSDPSNKEWLVCDDGASHRDFTSKCFNVIQKIHLFNKNLKKTSSSDPPITVTYLDKEKKRGIILNNRDFERLFNHSDGLLSKYLPTISEKHKTRLVEESRLPAIESSAHVATEDGGINDTMGADVSTPGPGTPEASGSQPQPTDRELIYLKQYEEQTGITITPANSKDVAIAMEDAMYKSAIKNGRTIDQAVRDAEIVRLEKLIQDYLGFITTSNGANYAQNKFDEYKAQVQKAAEAAAAQKAVEAAAQKALEDAAAQKIAAAAAQKVLEDAAAQKVLEDAALKQQQALKLQQQQEALKLQEQKREALQKALQQQQSFQEKETALKMAASKASPGVLLDNDDKMKDAVLKTIGLCMFILNTYLVGFKLENPQVATSALNVLYFDQSAELDAVDQQTWIPNMSELLLVIGYKIEKTGSYSKTAFVRNVRMKITHPDKNEISKNVGYQLTINTTIIGEMNNKRTTIFDRYKRDYELFLKYVDADGKLADDETAVATRIKDDIWDKFSLQEKSEMGVKKKQGFFAGLVSKNEYEQSPAWSQNVIQYYTFLFPIFKNVFLAKLRLSMPTPYVAASPATAPPPVVATPPASVASGTTPPPPATAAATPPKPAPAPPATAAATPPNPAAPPQPVAAAPPQPVAAAPQPQHPAAPPVAATGGIAAPQPVAAAPPVVLQPEYSMLQSALVSDLQHVVSDEDVVKAAEDSEKAIAIANTKMAVDKLRALDKYVIGAATAKHIKIEPNDQVEIKQPLGQGPFPFDNPTDYQIMKSSGHENDCLVHSLLTSCSATFRKLSLDGRNTIASEFRRTVLVLLFDRLLKQSQNTQTMNDELARNLADLRIDKTLDSYVAGQFGEEYGIGVLIQDRGNVWRLMGSPKFGVPFIILHNPGVNHYDSVRCVNADKPSMYLFLRKIISRWESDTKRASMTPLQLSCTVGVPESKAKATASTLRTVKTGTIIASLTDALSNYLVVNTKTGDIGCKSIYVIKYDADKYSENQVEYKNQFGELVSEIQRRISAKQSFAGLPNIYNIGNDSTKYEVSMESLAGGGINDRVVKQTRKRNGNKSVKRRHMSSIQTEPTLGA
jgi:hypothetical protein